MIKIAISGRARTGKNTLAEMISDQVSGAIISDIRCKIVAVADPIKRMVMEMVPNADPECLYGQSELRSRPLPGLLKDEDGQPLTYRKLLTDLGKQGRKYNPDVWLNALVKNAEQNKHLKGYFVSDCRFPNEMQYLRDHGFYMIRIKRKNAPLIEDESETAQLSITDDFFNEIVDNDYCIDTLRDKARSIYNHLNPSVSIKSALS